MHLTGHHADQNAVLCTACSRCKYSHHGSIVQAVKTTGGKMGRLLCMAILLLSRLLVRGLPAHPPRVTTIAPCAQL